MITCPTCQKACKTAQGLTSHLRFKHSNLPVSPASPASQPASPDTENLETVGTIETLDELYGDLTQEISVEGNQIVEALSEVSREHTEWLEHLDGHRSEKLEHLDEKLESLRVSVSRLSQQVQNVCLGLIGISEQIRKLQQPEPAPRPENGHSDEQIVVIR